MMMLKNNCFKLYQSPVLGVIALTGVFMAGCATTPPPLELMAVSRAAVSDANNAGANELAPVQYKSALEEIERADLAMANKDYAQAQKLAELAQVDAKLAGAMARSAKAKKAADALQEASRILSQEIGRTTK